ncbi:MAG TPA: hypothetical protein PKJ16_06925 [Spirochaetota bacterium]|nr:hypothetical protein [Spirochaetota bacterium]
MMRTRINMVAVMMLGALMLFAATGRAHAFRNVKKVSAIEFKGLKYLTKYELISAADTVVEQDGIVIDVDSLEAALRKNLYVKDYRIVEKDRRITVTVEEKRPALVMAIEKEGAYAFIELDGELAALSYNRVHAADRPLVVVPWAFAHSGSLSKQVRDYLRTILEAEKSGLKVCRELTEVYIRSDGKVRIRLRGRRTEFLAEMNRAALERLNTCVGFLDAAGRYPAHMNIFDTFGVMK